MAGSPEDFRITDGAALDAAVTSGERAADRTHAQLFGDPDRVQGKAATLSDGALEALARLRLQALPAVAGVRLDYRPVPGGEADVEGAVLLAPGHPLSRSALPGLVLRALGGEVLLSAAFVPARGAPEG